MPLNSTGRTVGSRAVKTQKVHDPHINMDGKNVLEKGSSPLDDVTDSSRLFLSPLQKGWLDPCVKRVYPIHCTK